MARETLLGLVSDLARRSWVSVDATHYLDDYLASQWLPPSALAGLQQAKLRRLVWHCYLNVPRLRARLERALPPSRIETLDDPDALPVSTPAQAGGGEPLPEGATLERPENELRDRRRAVKLRAERWAGAPPGRIAPHQLGQGVFARGKLTALIRDASAPIQNSSVPIHYWYAPGGELAAAGCERGGLHALADHVLIEIVDDAGRAQPPGSDGKIVVTDLHDYVAPRLRQETGERARILPGACPCGRAFPRLLFR